MPFGLTPAGFSIKTVDDILSDIEAKELALISPSLDVQPTALMGIINGIFAGGLAELWQLAGALYNGMDPDQATSDQLASLSAITGTIREPATSTDVLACVVNVNAGFLASPGTMFASINGNPAAQFTNVQAVSNPGGIAANETADFICTQTGPIQALAGTLTVIAQPLSGWNSITNPTDGVTGKDIESDAALRVRRAEDLAAAGSSTADAIRADVLNKMIVPVTTTNTESCTVLFNDADTTDANGLPPHSIEVIARQPGATTADDIALAGLILTSKAAGDGTYGLSSKIVADSQGNTDTIKYTRPADVLLYIAITVLTDPKFFPLDGVARIKAAIVAYGAAALHPGSTVYVKHLQAQAFGGQVVGSQELTPPVPGVLDITSFAVDTIAVPVNTANIVIGIRSIAVLDTARIFVTVT